MGRLTQSRGDAKRGRRERKRKRERGKRGREKARGFFGGNQQRYLDVTRA
jgi:hypothetical protein